MTLCWILIFLTFGFLKANASEMEIYAQVGETVTLPRDTYKGSVDDSSDGTLQVYVNWIQDKLVSSDVIISRHPHSGIQREKNKTGVSLLRDFSLQISPMTESYFGLIRCNQHLLQDMYSKSYRLLRVTVRNEPAVIIGETLTLGCELEKGRFSGTEIVSWVPPESSNCNLNIPISQKTVSVQNVPMCASGVWTCHVKYDGREFNATTTVYVIDLAPAPPNPIYTYVNDVVNIPCSLSSDIPWSILNESGLQKGSWSFTPPGSKNQQPLLSLIVGPQTKWTVTEDAQISVKPRAVTDKDLSILKLPVSENVRGEYTCSLDFKSKTFSRKVKVEVLKVSGISNSSVEGQKMNLLCSLGPHSITPEVKWSCRSCSTHPLLITSPHPKNLSFPVRMEDNGEWRCELWNNDERLTYVKFSLRIEKLPVNIWLWIGTSSGVVVFILLCVIIVIAIRRQNQMAMYRRRKTKFCCCKSPQPKGFYKT